MHPLSFQVITLCRKSTYLIINLAVRESITVHFDLTKVLKLYLSGNAFAHHDFAEHWPSFTGWHEPSTPFTYASPDALVLCTLQAIERPSMLEHIPVRKNLQSELGAPTTLLWVTRTTRWISYFTLQHINDTEVSVNKQIVTATAFFILQCQQYLNKKKNFCDRFLLAKSGSPPVKL